MTLWAKKLVNLWRMIKLISLIAFIIYILWRLKNSLGMLLQYVSQSSPFHFFNSTNVSYLQQSLAMIRSS